MRDAAGGLVLVVGAAVLLAACGQPVVISDGQIGGGREGPATVRTGVARVPVAEREPAPDLKGPRLGGGSLSLAGYRGEVVVVNVWGSWCPPCREEAPHLRRVWQETRGEGVQLLGIDTRDTEMAARAFEREFGIGYPSFVDPDGRLLLRFRGVIPVQAVPSTVVIDRQGRVAVRIVGPTRYEELRGLVDEIRAERKQQPG